MSDHTYLCILTFTFIQLMLDHPVINQRKPALLQTTVIRND